MPVPDNHHELPAMPKGKTRPMNFHCHRVRVGDAGVKGRGVFARCAIQAREAVEVAPALLIPRRDESAIDSTFLANYAFSHNDAFDLIGLGYISLYNHSFDPNAQFVLMERAILITALRPIAEGEEILIDYGWSDADFEAVGIPKA